MRRRRFLGWAGALAGIAPRMTRAADLFDPLARGSAPPGAAVIPGRALRFPDDEGSHPEFRTEWWYVTGWMFDAARHPLGFQVTFFRNRAIDTRGNPSRFAPVQLYAAHAALADPQRGRLVTMQRLARGGFGLAEAAQGGTDVRLDGWSLRAEDGRLAAKVPGRDFGFDFALARTQPPLIEGEAGVSRKGPAADALSWYYTLPQLALDGSLSRDGRTVRVTGRAWLDHEWSSTPMDPAATGWDWVGINLDDGGALMAFRMRGTGEAVVWAGGTLRGADSRVTTFAPAEVRWQPLRRWRSPRTAAEYPVGWRIELGGFEFELEPLFDDQENDARATTGTVYWEGAVTARAGGRAIGRGYLELTGYWRAFRL